MDNATFTIFSQIAVLGGALGSFVGLGKLAAERTKTENQVMHLRKESMTTSDTVKLYASDVTRTIGYIGMHTMYGMIAYTVSPLFFVRDMRRMAKEKA